MSPFYPCGDRLSGDWGRESREGKANGFDRQTNCVQAGRKSFYDIVGVPIGTRMSSRVAVDRWRKARICDPRELVRVR